MDSHERSKLLEFLKDVEPSDEWLISQICQKFNVLPSKAFKLWSPNEPARPQRSIFDRLRGFLRAGARVCVPFLAILILWSDAPWCIAIFM